MNQPTRRPSGTTSLRCLETWIHAGILTTAISLLPSCDRPPSSEPPPELGADLVGTGSTETPTPFPGPCDTTVSGEGQLYPHGVGSRVSIDHDYNDDGNETRRVEVFDDGSRLITTSHYDLAGNLLREVQTSFVPEEGTCCGRDTQYTSDRSTTTYDYSCW